MKVQRQWTDEVELFEAVASCLENIQDYYESGEIETDARDERDSYDSDGYITIKVDGRRFRVELAEIL